MQAVAAIVLARAGKMAAAQKLAAELGNTFPLDMLVQRYWLPSRRAAIALERKDPGRAVELLKIANPIELGQSTAALTISLCPAYLRGQAFLMLHEGNAAGGISEIHRPPRTGSELSMGRDGRCRIGARLRDARRHRQG